jgi:hypothetical protein
MSRSVLVKSCGIGGIDGDGVGVVESDISQENLSVNGV